MKVVFEGSSKTLTFRVGYLAMCDADLVHSSLLFGLPGYTAG